MLLKNPLYKHGRYTKQRYCKCGLKIAGQNKSGLCLKCYHKSIKTKPKLCKCGNIKSFYAIECNNCSFKKRVGESNPNWRGGILNVHHIKSITNFMYNELEKAHAISNLVTLCRKCHNKIHDLI